MVSAMASRVGLVGLVERVAAVMMGFRQDMRDLPLASWPARPISGPGLGRCARAGVGDIAQPVRDGNVVAIQSAIVRYTSCAPGCWFRLCPMSLITGANV